MKHAALPGAIVLASTLGVAAQRGALPLGSNRTVN
jgi:hypothetical protein